MTKILDTPFTNSYKSDTLNKKEQSKLGVKYMKKIKNQFAYLLIITLTFYGLPLIDRESEMLVLCILFPLVCFLSAIVYGIKYLFSLVYSILVMLLFIPTIFIFYNETASIYIGVYGVISLVGNLLGSFIRKIDDRK